MPGTSLLRRFAVLSAVLIALLGAVLGYLVRQDVQDRALDQAARDARLVARLTIQPLLTPDDVSSGLGAAARARLDEALEAARAAGVSRVKVWSADGTIVYSDASSLIGRTFPPTDDLRRALDGHVASEVSSLDAAEEETERHLGRLLEVYVPLQFSTGPPVGVFELYLPYAPIQRSIDDGTRRIYLVLGTGLLVLYAGLFRLMARAARTMRQQAAENERLTLRDPLTELPNRALFRERAEQAIRSARRSGSLVALMVLDLDRFRLINDTLGHEAGDALLSKIGSRLQTALRETDTVARLGADEFAILLPEVADRAAASLTADRLLKTLEFPFPIGGVSVEVEASVGVALFPDHGDEFDELIQRADGAMYAAKDAGTRYELFVEERDRHSPERLSLLSELRGAIQRGDIVLHYQPKADLRSGRVVGVEALVRWDHPDLGLLPSDRFVPLAEPTALIGPLTRHVVDEALRECRAWRDAGIDLHVAVNLSARNLEDARLPDQVARSLERWGVESDALELEITESAILQEPVRVMEVVSQLASMGIRLVIDDFGTGYSSMAYLRRLPVRALKIDKSFVMGMLREENDAVIVRSTIDLGRNLGLQVVAEGVESAQLWTRLAALGCDVAQGFHLSPPIPASEVPAWLEGWSARVDEGVGVPGPASQRVAR
ncbi:MAG TPA: EAL domain-containing protein [Actinomycetota bacterium]|nr:EAL domain-containing protein [Actinomycetota bacterium]